MTAPYRYCYSNSYMTCHIGREDIYDHLLLLFCITKEYPPHNQCGSRRNRNESTQKILKGKGKKKGNREKTGKQTFALRRPVRPPFQACRCLHRRESGRKNAVAMAAIVARSARAPHTFPVAASFATTVAEGTPAATTRHLRKYFQRLSVIDDWSRI